MPKNLLHLYTHRTSILEKNLENNDWPTCMHSNGTFSPAAAAVLHLWWTTVTIILTQ
jgi:hypothetical protein